MSDIPGPPQRERASPWPFVGMIALACDFFLIAASVLVTPWYVVGALLLLWGAALVVATAWWSLHPTRLLWLAVALAAAWFATVVGGAALFGWS